MPIYFTHNGQRYSARSIAMEFECGNTVQIMNTNTEEVVAEFTDHADTRTMIQWWCEGS